MWWVSSLLSLVTTPKPHHSEPLICIHGWLTAGAPFPLECSTWGEVHERTHIAHLSAWLDPEMGWEGSCLDSALSVKSSFLTEIHFLYVKWCEMCWNQLDWGFIELSESGLGVFVQYFFFFFLPRLTLKYGCDTVISQKYTITICSDSIRVNHSPHSHPTESPEKCWQFTF